MGNIHVANASPRSLRVLIGHERVLVPDIEAAGKVGSLPSSESIEFSCRTSRLPTTYAPPPPHPGRIESLCRTSRLLAR